MKNEVVIQWLNGSEWQDIVYLSGYVSAGQIQAEMRSVWEMKGTRVRAIKDNALIDVLP